MKLHLIDGTYELFRAHFGAPSGTSQSGQEVGATRGLLRSMAALLRQEEVTHIGFAFDTQIESFRNELFDGYKTGEGMEPELFAQFPLAERAARALGIVTWSMIEFEADDAIASAAHKYSQCPDLKEVLMCSPDKDLCQMIRDEGPCPIRSFDRMREKLYDCAAVEEKFGISPASIPDYLALVGDTADGIPGLKRWGAKSTSTLLKRYQQIEQIPSSEKDWDIKVRGAAGLSKVLEEERENALLYRKLATLRTDVPLGESLEDLRWKGPDSQDLAALCDELRISPPKLPQL